jgi:hypothetical protein
MYWRSSCNTSTWSTTNPTRIFAVRCLLATGKFIQSVGGWFDPRYGPDVVRCVGRRRVGRRRVMTSWLLSSYRSHYTELPRLRQDEDRSIFMFVRLFVDVKPRGCFASSLRLLHVISIFHHTISFLIHLLSFPDPRSLFYKYNLP